MSASAGLSMSTELGQKHLTYNQAKAMNAPAGTCDWCWGPMSYQPYMICLRCTEELNAEGKYIEVRDELYPLIKRAGMKTTCGPEKEEPVCQPKSK